MSRRKRAFSPFSLAFLDVMSCGFGAAVLLFLVIRHDAAQVPAPARAPAPVTAEQELTRIAEDIARARETLDALGAERSALEAQGQELAADVRAAQQALAAEPDTPESAAAEASARVEALKEALVEREAQRDAMRAAQDDAPSDNLAFRGDGQREYLTGMRIDGKHVLILFDRSASMLDDTIVNILRLRNMATARKVQAPKWQRAVRTAEWLLARLPRGTNFQCYLFSEEATPALPATAGRWLPVADGKALGAVRDALRSTEPTGATSLERAFAVAASLSPRPDSIFLITDGLPTLGDSAPKRGRISGERRLRLFEQAARKLPDGIPVNVILFPLEGDPLAAPAYWQLAQASRGAFMAPSDGWP